MTFTMTTAVRRGRPSATAANDNEAAYAERAETIRKMRDNGKTYREIADELSMDVRLAWISLNGRKKARTPLAANDNKVVRKVANNGGCSTTSGMVSVSVARVPTMERQPVQVAA